MTGRRSACERAAYLARVEGLSTAAIARALDVTPRTARAYLADARAAGISTEPAPTDANDGDQTANQAAPRRKEPRSFRKRRASKGGGGKLLKPFTVGGVGGFDLLPSLDTSGLGPNLAVGDVDEWGRVKMSEQVIDLGERHALDPRPDESGAWVVEFEYADGRVGFIPIEDA
jgi:hypothetical protein